MRGRVGPWLAWSTAAVTAALLAGMLGFTARYPVSGGSAGDWFILLLLMLSFPTVGTIVALRRPANPIGWIFCAMGTLFVVAILVGNYAEYGLDVDPGSLQGAGVAAAISTWIWLTVITSVFMLLLLFPDGRPPSKRWRAVVWILGGSMVGWAVARTFDPGPLVDAGFDTVNNPLGIEGAEAILVALASICALLMFVGSILAIAALVVRYRRSRGEERRQLKWLAFAGGLVGAVATISLTAEGVLGDEHLVVRVTQLTLLSSIAAVPVATGIAILRHRLYDIDVIVNRTLVYGSLTALLAVVYVAGVFVSSGLVRTITGEGQNNSLAVAASTLAVAALFRPARARIQSLIDRRFYRAKYDAAQTLEGFSARLRDEVDLDALSRELLVVVRQTMHPSSASLWLKEER